VLIAYYAQQRKKGLQIHQSSGSCLSEASSTIIKGADKQEEQKGDQLSE
jgi:hypothetical protein